MRKQVLALALSLAGGCASRGLETSAIVGTWARSAPDGACLSYAFRADGSMVFSDGATQLDGGYVVEGAHLALGFDGRPTVAVPYAIGHAPGDPPAWPAFDTLTITDDPATVSAGEHRDVVYGRHLCAP